MHNAWLVIQREYIERIRSKAFIIMTLLMPLFMASTILIPALLSNLRSGVTRHIVLVANHGELAEAIKQQLIAPPITADTQYRSERNLRLPASQSKSAPTLLRPSATNCGMMSRMARLTAFSG